MAAVPDELPEPDRGLVANLLAAKPDEFTDLTATQAQAFAEGALDDGNHLLIAETGNGKTFVAEARIQKALNDNGRVAYTIPSTALRNEKYETFKQWLPDEIKVVNGGPYHDADVIVTTFESFFAAAIRGLVTDYDLVVFDDFHVIYDTHRGPAIEKAISAAKDADMEIFAMSATVGNPDVIAQWIDGRLTISDEPRCVPIRERPVEKLPAREAPIGDQVADVIRDNPDKGPFLVFNSTRKNAEARAKAIAKHVSFDTDTDFEQAVRVAISTELTDTHEAFIELLNAGIAYHHAGLDYQLRDLVEEYTDAGEIQVVSATTTLSYGFNSPVQSVIVADLRRYNFEMNRSQFIGVYEYVQMIGRAGRDEALYDEAYAFPMASSDDAHETFQFDRSVEEKDLEPAFSHVQSRERLRWLVLELIVHGWESDTDVLEFITHTLFWQQAVEGQATLPGADGFTAESERIADIRDGIEDIFDWLAARGLIIEPVTQPATDETRYTATGIGEAVVEYNFSNWLPNTVAGVCGFIEWLHQHHGDLSPETLVERLATMYDRHCNLGVEIGNDNVEAYMHNLDYPISSSAGATAAIVCWGWCQGSTLSRIQHQFQVDDLTYLPSVARRLTQALDAIPVLYRPDEMPPVPRWLDPFTRRVEHGVPGADVYLLENTDYLGRRKYNRLQSYLDQLGESDWDPGRDRPVIERLHRLYEQRDEDDVLFRDFARSVPGIGQAISMNLLTTIQDWNPKAETPGDTIPYQLSPDVLPDEPAEE